MPVVLKSRRLTSEQTGKALGIPEHKRAVIVETINTFQSGTASHERQHRKASRKAAKKK